MNTDVYSAKQTGSPFIMHQVQAGGTDPGKDASSGDRDTSRALPSASVVTRSPPVFSFARAVPFSVDSLRSLSAEHHIHEGRKYDQCPVRRGRVSLERLVLDGVGSEE